MAKKYAFVHPGKIGDLLYILPAAKAICTRDGAVADIYTSEVCRAAERLIRYQPYVNDFVVPANYVIRDAGQGVQPWSMDVPGGYDAVYQLGYEHFPKGPLHIYTALRAGLPSVEPPQFECPDISYFEEPYVVVAHCDHRTHADLRRAYEYFVGACPVKTVQIGLPEDWVGGPSENMTGLDLLETASLIKKAKAYVGFYSGQLAIANGFPGLPKIITMWRGVGEQHGLYIPITIDLEHPDGAAILRTVEKFL